MADQNIENSFFFKQKKCLLTNIERTQDSLFQKTIADIPD
jgi:hypothetical protein